MFIKMEEILKERAGEYKKNQIKILEPKIIVTDIKNLVNGFYDQ